MGEKSLKDDLANSLITFNQRVLLTDLMDEYELPFTEVQNVVQSHIEEQEKINCIKCDKRYLVNGQDEKSGNEIYTIVSQGQLDVWLKKLKESECKLYSVELMGGGSKTAAQEVMPMRFCTIGYADSKKALDKKNPMPEEDMKKPIISQVKNESNIFKGLIKRNQEIEKKIINKTNSKVIDEKPILEKKKTSPIENKKPLKDKDQIVKEKLVSPKNVNDFFKKNTKQQKKLEINSSMQLFDEDEEAKSTTAQEVPSSDEEEMLDAMRREITNHDNQEEKHPTGSSKRRRILDSDDDDDDAAAAASNEDGQPLAKQEKHEKSLMETSKSETYLDEDGFVLTIKPKKNAMNAMIGKPLNNKISPPAKKSSPIKGKSKISKKPPPPPKTKQGNITSFFTKKSN